MSIFTILKKFEEKNYRLLHILILSISVLALCVAYYVEYQMGLKPCPLCIYQRFPYLSLIKISLTGLIVKSLSKYTLFFLSLTLSAATLLAGYHTGIERKIFKPSSFCSSLITLPEHLSIQAIKEMLYSQPVANCSSPALKIFQLSMTEWNMLLNLGLLFLVIAVWLHGRKNAKT